MSNMVLDGYTFTHNPDNLPVIKKDLTLAHVKTYDDIAVMSWGSSYIGVILPLGWKMMRKEQWDDLHDIYEADEEVVFDPQDGNSKTFNVRVIRLDGSHFLGLSLYKDVTMELLIMSEVT